MDVANEIMVRGIVVGVFQENCWVVGNRRTGEAICIDPGDQPEEVLALAKDMGGDDQGDRELARAYRPHSGGSRGTGGDGGELPAAPERSGPAAERVAGCGAALRHRGGAGAAGPERIRDGWGRGGGGGAEAEGDRDAGTHARERELLRGRAALQRGHALPGVDWTYGPAGGRFRRGDAEHHELAAVAAGGDDRAAGAHAGDDGRVRARPQPVRAGLAATAADGGGGSSVPQPVCNIRSVRWACGSVRGTRR